MQVLKSVNAKPDLLSYCILLELVGSDGGLIARSYLQKFRAQRMSGYVAMYEEWDEGTIDKVLASSESLNAIIFDLTGGD